MQRRFLKCNSHNWLVHKIIWNSLSDIIPKYAAGRLLDIGCGEKPYKDLLAPYLSEHVGLDYLETLHIKSNIDLFAAAYEIPEEDASFDCALCTAVIEHLEEPELEPREC